ncbi:MAG TPA: response regulator [Candidatus Competibacter sp.]|jgi:CheY-like chemotaxis protein|nr:response regulator [Candidatus Competibacteraceae bacterium]HRE54997.1 response regulator [Candidatus Competibacter sp.]HUM93801.1 response regulator [Candidatus Competibacter sp.]
MNIKKALVVDDSKVAHLTLRKLLLERSVEVDWVGSGEDCIKYLDNKKPDIIFMDVMMPGMDGFETSRAITGQNLQDSPPIIMCSANATDEDKRDAKESGAVGFLSKPYTPDQLDAVLNGVSEGTAAIALEDAATPAHAIPLPSVVEKPTPAPAAPAMAASEAPSAPRTPTEGTSDIEQLAERVAWAAAEKVARDIIQELVPNLTREIATQTARGVSEDLGRRAAHAAVRAAQEAAKQVATEIARGTAERTARSAAQESARSVAEQAAREVSEGVSQRNVARGLEINREELFKEIETQIDQQSKANLTLMTSSPEFKQQIIQSVRSGLQPVIETIAREAAERSIAQAGSGASESGLASRVSLALTLGVIALLGSAAALLGYVFKLF